MNISSPKNSIAKSIGAPTNGLKNLPNNKGETKANGQVVKSTEATNTNDAEVAKEESTTWEPGKPISKDADKAAADTTKALWSGYWDFKKSELDHQRGLQQDQLAFQKEQIAQQTAQQNQQIGLGIAAQGIGALGQMITALGQATGAGGSSGSGSSGGGSSGSSRGSGETSGKPEGEIAQSKKGFEDQDKITRVDSKGNPIIDDAGKGTAALAQNQGHSPETPTPSRSSSHQELESKDSIALAYDSENGISIGSHEEMRGNQQDDISFSVAKNDETQIHEPEIKEPEIPELDLEVTA